VAEQLSTKAVFRDFSKPVHHGKRKQEGNACKPAPKVDIISNSVQSTLEKAEMTKLTKQEKIVELQK